jgi:hypothetical protein
MKKLLVAIGIVGLVVGSAGTASAASIGIVPDGGCLAYGSFFFCDADIQPTGTGVFQPFLRTNPGGNQDPSSGWNTGAGKQAWADPNDADDSWTSQLAAASLGTVGDPINNLGSYAVFTVDINQQGKPGTGSSKLSLLHFELYSCASSNYTSLSQCTSTANIFGGTLGYDASDRPTITGSTDWVDFDYKQTSSGSGAGDINVYVPFNLIGGPFVALLDGWGTYQALGTYPDNDGYQEWKGLQGGQTCPGGGPLPPGGIDDCDVVVGAEPTSLLLFGMAALGAGYVRRRRVQQ